MDRKQVAVLELIGDYKQVVANFLNVSVAYVLKNNLHALNSVDLVQYKVQSDAECEAAFAAYLQEADELDLQA